MGEQTEIEQKMNKFTHEFGINEIDINSPKIYSQLKLIENFFQQQERDQEYYYNKLKNARKLSISKVSEVTEISRSSIYNSPNILQLYIECRMNILAGKDISGLSELKNNDEKMKFLVKVNDGLQQEIINGFENKMYTDKLQSEIELLSKRRKSDISEIYLLNQEILKLKKELKEYKKSNVININTK